MTTLNIFSAGVAMALTRQTVEKWNAQHPESQAEMQAGGSVDGLRRSLAGEPFDLLILADDTIIETMMKPTHTSGYYIFAGNKMVVAAAEGREINNDNWQEKLLAPEAKFMHMNPYGDPGGYRAVMAMMLADHYEKGLSAKLLNHPGHLGMDPNLNPRQMPPFDYIFTYRSGAKMRGLSFAELPEVMDLSSPALAQIYASVEFKVDGGQMVKGAPIAHALTIPQAAPNPELAYQFAEMFLQIDFQAHYFLPRNQAVGLWPPKF